MNTMKKTTILFFLIAFSFSNAQIQRFTLNVASSPQIEFRIYLDGELQSYTTGKNYKIAGVTQGEKELTLTIYAPTGSVSSSLKIGKSGKKEEFYRLVKKGIGYEILNISGGFKYTAENIPVLGTYIPKRKVAPVSKTPASPNYGKAPVVSSQTIGCEISDSMVNVLIVSLQSLKTEKAKEKLLNSTIKNKCLRSYQISAIVSRFDKDEERFNEYKKYYDICFDKSNYKNLVKNFKTMEIAKQFEKWLESK